MSKALTSLLLLTLSGLLWSAGCASSETHTGQTHQNADASTDSSPGSCDITFCPHDGMGVACCVTANGPCGYDMGTGCVANDSTSSSTGGTTSGTGAAAAPNTPP